MDRSPGTYSWLELLKMTLAMPLILLLLIWIFLWVVIYQTSRGGIWLSRKALFFLEPKGF